MLNNCFHSFYAQSISYKSTFPDVFILLPNLSNVGFGVFTIMAHFSSAKHISEKVEKGTKGRTGLTLSFVSWGKQV